jgi:hypothetical protein
MTARTTALLCSVLALLLGAAAPGRAQQQPGPTNPRLLPDISAVGDLIADLSPARSLAEGGDRFSIREIELALQAAVDPFFRGDIFLGVSDEEGVAVEQAYLTAMALPGALEVRLGRYLMPLGKQNTTHRHDLHTIEYPYVLQQFLGDEGMKGTGLWLGRVFSPLGFYQEILLTAVERLGEAEEDEPEAPELANRSFRGLGYSARLRNYWDVSESSNLELSFSGATNRRPQPLADGSGINARQSLIGADLTFRWRPLREGLYRSFILQGEVMRQYNERIADPAYEGARRDYTGAYVFARYQLTRRLFLGARGDWVQTPADDGDDPLAAPLTRAGSGYLEFFPSEFSKLLAGYERVRPGSGAARDRLLLQAAFALGPHRPHPF